MIRLAAFVAARPVSLAGGRGAPARTVAAGAGKARP